MQFAMLPLQAFDRAQPIISYNYGARNADREGRVSASLKVSLIYSTLIWLFVQVVPQAFAGIVYLGCRTPGIYFQGARIYMACVFMFGIQIARQMAFTSPIGFAKESIIVAVDPEILFC